jgi:uncharacterized membrane protein
VTHKALARTAFATGIIALAVICLVFGDFADIWHSLPAPAHVRDAMAYASAGLMLACGIGLLSNRTEARAASVLAPFFALLVLVIKLPPVLEGPLVEGNWQSMSEIVVLLTGAWVLSASRTREMRVAQLVFGLALIPLGLSHFVYVNLTAPLVPAWLPYHTGWAYFTGAAHLAAALGVILGILPQLAAAMEAAMLSVFTVLVWIPLIYAAPTSRGSWSEFTLSWAISGAAWVVAASFGERNLGTSDVR